MRISTPFTGILLVMALGLGSSACCDGALCSSEEDIATAPDPRFEPAFERDCDARLARICAEIAGLGAAPGWAAEYYEGDGLGANVLAALAPTSGFAYSWSGCMGVYDRNHGTITEKDGRLELQFALANDAEGIGCPSVLVPVNWGARRYPVTPEDLPKFMDAARTGAELRAGSWGSYLLVRGDEKKTAEGVPEVGESARSGR